LEKIVSASEASIECTTILRNSYASVARAGVSLGEALNQFSTGPIAIFNGCSDGLARYVSAATTPVLVLG